MYERALVSTLASRLAEPRKFIQVVTGPRQTGKTTAVKQALQKANFPSVVASADGIAMRGADWIETQWIQARQIAKNEGMAILVLDEIQKIKDWSEIVKRLWDSDTWNEVELHVVLSGSSSLLLKKGLSESLAGRFEVIYSTHWSLGEMQEAFAYSLDDYLMFGGFPGSAILHNDTDRWLTYMRDSIIEATISRDVLLMEDVRKPALLKALFELGVQYSGQEISYRKLLGQLDDKGNVETIAHYLELLNDAGMLCGLQKFDGKALKQRNSSPRLLAYDTSLMTASWENKDSILDDAASRGHLVETAVGAYLLSQSILQRFKLYWWRDGDNEVDFVLKKGNQTLGIEVKSGKIGRLTGLENFRKQFPESTTMIIGEGYIPTEDFLKGKVSLF